ncbi:Peptidase S12, Pab87-related, C-terminal [Lasallia pustulata]|uniref:Peptidase S12, Pab87-related, C-terminal n=1 Tax=Lasallia pustulata TaxID=136370 RepID=A0A1W5CZ75_9LECA|nr:Peptidase S12, Pab87-related, C-terminal [Lasallia pustulata]
MRWIIALFLASSLASAAEQVPLGGGAYSPLDGDFEHLVKQKLSEWHVPGVSVAVVHNNKTYAKGYGIAQYPSQPVTPSTLFYTGSTTKAFTAAAISLLVDSEEEAYKNIKWTTPLYTLIGDDFILPDYYATTHTTLEDALSHRSGMPRHDMSYGGPNFTRRDMVRSLRNLPLTAEPRTKYQYCNMMFVAVAYALEAVTGQWLGDFLRERIWEPLGMQTTFFALPDAKKAVKDGKAEIAKGYKWEAEKEEFREVEWMDNYELSGAGGVISTVLDYAQWMKMLMNQAPPLSKQGHEALTYPRIIAEKQGPPFDATLLYALGWAIETYGGERLWFHDGGMPGFGTELLLLPDMNWGIVLMLNTAESSNFAGMGLMFHLIDEFLEVPQEKRFDWDEKFRNRITSRRSLASSAHHILYPHTPTPPLPHSLPLSAYTGTYHHPSYQSLTLTLANLTLPSCNTSSTYLFANMTDHMWDFTLRLEHVSGEFFVAMVWAQDLDAFDVETPAKAEFRVGEGGEVRWVGVALEEAMGEEKIWWERV